MQLKEDVDTQTLSKMTPGFTGAEIANMVNHAIISAVDKDAVILTKNEFEEARDRIILGLIKKSGFKTDKQLLYSAIHEAGHTLVCYMNPLCKDSIFKVSVVPRGSNNKGKTSTLFEDREGTKEEFQTMIDMALGGVLAEEIYFGTEKVTSGCGNDLNRASALANSMVKKYGMNSSDWGYMVVDDGVELEHRIGSNTRDSLDTASQKIVETSEKRVRNILSENLNRLKDLAQKLCEYEELNKEEIDQILSGKSMDKENSKKTAKRSFSISSVAI
jgi:ATP-dependent Zn protease